MNDLNRIINEAGVSKVQLAKYLGVSRQMLYNYLSLDLFSGIPKDKQTKILNLFGIKKISDISNIVIDDDLIKRLERKLNNKENASRQKDINPDFKGLNKKEQELLFDVFNLIKEKIMSNNKDGVNILRYLHYYLQAMENMPELKYILGYMAKTNLYIPVNEYVFDEDKQYTFEGILFSAMSIYNNGVAAPSKVSESHKKFEMEIESKKEEKLSRTEELNTFRVQALSELGYSAITEANAKEVFEKIAEIMSRKF